jgi:hypothetical protein
MAIALRVHPTLSPRIVEILPPTTSVTVQDLYGRIKEWEQEPANASFAKLADASGLEPLGSGVSVGVTVTLLNTRVMYTGRCAPLTGVGVCTADDPTGKVLTQAGIDFVATGVYPGCSVYNYTTGSMASVVEVVSPDTLRSFEVRGGSRETWLIGDECLVYPNVQCDIGGGNLVALDDLGNEMPAIYQSPNVQIIKTSSSSATMAGTAVQEELSYQGVVCIDTTLGVPGTEYPIGTKNLPSSNLADAKRIADGYGFRDFELRGSVLLDQSFSGYNFTGGSILLNDGININGKNVGACHFKFLTLQGAPLAGSQFDATNCRIDGITGLWGNYVECDIRGDVTFVDRSSLNGCYASEDSHSVVHIDGASTSVSFVRWSGPMTLSGITLPGQTVDVFTVSGKVTIDSSCTDGHVTVAGVCVVTDNSGLDCEIDRIAQIEASPGAYRDEVLLDVENGAPGTHYPMGTTGHPVDNLDDALTIANAIGLPQITFVGELTLDQSLDGIRLVGGAAVEICIIHLNNQVLRNVGFEHCVLRGKLNVVRDEEPIPGWRPMNYGVEFVDVYLKAIEDLEGSAYRCTAEGTTLLKPGGWFSASNLIIEGNYTVFDFRNTPYTVVSADISSGWVQCINAVTNCRLELNVKGGEISLYPSCTGGLYYLEGIGTLFNESAMEVTENHLPWDEPMSYHQIGGSMGANQQHGVVKL